MDAEVGGHFGVEGGGHGSSLPDEDGVFVAGGEDFDGRAGAFDARGADVDLFEGATGEFGFGGEDGGVDLAAVGVAGDGDVEDSEAGLFGVCDLLGQEDAAGAGAEDGTRADELAERRKAFVAKEFENGRGFAAGDDEAFDRLEFRLLAHQHDLDTEPFEHRLVGGKVALHRKNTDLHL